MFYASLLIGRDGAKADTNETLLCNGVATTDGHFGCLAACSTAIRRSENATLCVCVCVCVCVFCVCVCVCVCVCEYVCVHAYNLRNRFVSQRLISQFQERVVQQRSEDKHIAPVN